MKPSPPILQLYTPADLPAVVALFTAAVHELAAADYTVDQLTAWAPAEPDWDRWQARLAGSRVWLARLDGQPAGFATLGEIGYLDLLYTHPRFVRRGVATRLLQQAESFGVPASGHYHTHASLTARPFFTRHGYVVTAADQVRLRGQTLRNFHMVKRCIPD